METAVGGLEGATVGAGRLDLGASGWVGVSSPEVSSSLSPCELSK